MGIASSGCWLTVRERPSLISQALYEGILLEANFASFFAAALLRHPVTLDDLPSLDAELHRSLLQIKRYDGDVEMLCLFFSVSVEAFGRVENRELVRCVPCCAVHFLVVLLCSFPA